MAGSNLFTGPKGLCSHCGQKSLVRLGSMTEPVRIRSWEVSEDLVRSIYESIRSVAKEGGAYMDTPEGKKYRTGKVVVCQRTKYCRKRAIQGKITAKLIWVAVEGGIGEATEALSGPFCGICWPDYKRKFEHEDGQHHNFPIYYVATNFADIQILFDELKDDESQAQDTSIREDAYVSEVDGLF